MKRLLAFVLITLAISAEGASANARKLPWVGMTFAMVRQAPGRAALLVQRIVPKGPSDVAGLRPGDMITTFNQVPVGFGDELDLLLYIGERPIGQRLTCGFVRAGRQMTTEIVVGTMPPESQRAWLEALDLAHRLRERRRP